MQVAYFAIAIEENLTILSSLLALILIKTAKEYFFILL